MTAELPFIHEGQLTLEDWFEMVHDADPMHTGLDAHGDALTPDEIEYLATCPGWVASENDESTADDPEVY